MSGENPLRVNKVPELADSGDSVTVVTDGISNLAIPVDAARVNIKTTALANGMTLADGVPGQLLTIVMAADGGNAVVTPANLNGNANITFANVGEAVVLLFAGAEWYSLGASASVA